MLVHELQVFKDTYQLVLKIYQAVPNMPTLHKHTIGQHLCVKACDLFVPIQMANRAEGPGERARHLEDFLLVFETVKVLLRIGYDVRAIPLRQYAAMTELTVSIGRQVNGWKKSSQTPPESPKPRQG